MDLAAVLLLVTATAALVAIPGPNVALIVANTLAHGPRFGAMTVLGTTVGVALQLAAVVSGLAALLHIAAGVMVWLKWAGVAYLIWLGISAWRKGRGDAVDVPEASRVPAATHFWQGLGMAMVNPKTLLFNAAFLPQFTGTQPTTAALATAAAIYLVAIGLGDLLWAVCAQVARPAILALGRLRHRLTGAVFIGSGVGLALVRVER